MVGTELRIGAKASCTAGPCGRVSRVVIDLGSRSATHVVVEPEGRSGLGRLVPLNLVDTASTGDIRLNCTQAHFDELGAAEETKLVPGGNGGYGGYGLGQAVPGPYVGRSSFGVAGGGGMGDAFDPVVVDTVPPGEIAMHSGEHVHATDGDIGQLQGFIVDPGNHHVTHVLLQEGHLWGRKKVAIPIDVVTGVVAGTTLNITKQEVERLPPCEAV